MFLQSTEHSESSLAGSTDFLGHHEDSWPLVRQVVKEVLAEKCGPLQEVVREVMEVEGGRDGRLRQVVREELMVAAGVGGDLRQVVRAMMDEELEEVRRDVRRLEDKLSRLGYN